MSSSLIGNEPISLINHDTVPMEIQTELSMEECSLYNNVFENIFQPEQ